MEVGNSRQGEGVSDMFKMVHFTITDFCDIDRVEVWLRSTVLGLALDREIPFEISITIRDKKGEKSHEG